MSDRPEDLPQQLTYQSVLARRDRVAKAIRRAFRTKKANPASRIIASVIKCEPLAVRRFLQHLADQEPKARKRAEDHAVRLLAHTGAFRRGFSVTVSPEMFAPYWAALEIRSSAYVQDGQETRLRVESLVLTGPAAGTRLITRNRTRYLGFLRFQVGASIRGAAGKEPSAQIPQMLHYVIYAAKLSQPGGGELRAEQVFALPSMISGNKRLVRRRLRSLNACPQGRLTDCPACPVGRDKCDRALRVRTIKKK